MHQHAGETRSIWMADAPPQFPALGEHASADVCVVGAGIAGMTTALLLAREGRSVIVVDDGPVGGGQTERTTAHLSNAIDDRYYEIERLHGAEGARLAAESHSAAIDCIERIVAEEGIDCGFERLDGFLVLADGDSVEVLEEELAAARRAGLADVELMSQANFEHFQLGTCLRFPRQAQFHPLQYLRGVTNSFLRLGGRIHGGTHAVEIVGGSPARVVTETGATITTSAIVVATNTPVNDRVAIHTKQAAYRTYVISMKVPAGALPRVLIWDTQDPYHYVRLFSSGAGENGVGAHEMLLIGGEDHKTGQCNDASDRYRLLEIWAREHFPVIGGVVDRWSGQVFESIDGLGFIGHNPLDAENVYISTGDSGMGMTHGTIAGMLLTDLIQKRPNAWASLYDPSRKMLKAAMHYARENTNTAWQYTDWLTPGEVFSIGEIAPGSGAIVRRGMSKVAVYRDEDSIVHELSAVCPHLGGCVQWNSCEHTWDCPAHGSRFDALGQVLSGPANSNLHKIDPVPAPRVDIVSEDRARRRPARPEPRQRG